MTDTIPGRGRVRFEFQGLMVGYYNRARKTYEVGVIPAPMHALKISVEKKGHLCSGGPSGIATWELSFDTIPMATRFWQLGIENAEADADLYIVKDSTGRPVPFDRKIAPSGDLRRDFRWVLDLEKDFPGHSPTLPMRRNLLWPIVHITNGMFYTHLPRGGDPLPFQHLDSKQGVGGVDTELGYVATVPAAELTVHPNGVLVLKVLQQGEPEQTGGELFRLPIEGDTNYLIRFENRPQHEHVQRVGERSHFQLYYMLFGVPPDGWYELKERPESGIRSPTGPPHEHINAAASMDHNHEVADTVIREIGIPNPYKCGIGALGNRTEPLV